jgi:hypothetical protein
VITLLATTKLPTNTMAELNSTYARNCVLLIDNRPF